MDYWILSTLESVVFIGFFLVAVYFFVPKAAKCWHLWKESGKSLHLTNAVASATGALFFLTADFLMFIRAILGN